MGRITISFKNTKRDNELYEYWNSLEDKSVEIKHILRKAMEEREGINKGSKSNSETKKDSINILDF